MKFFSSDKRLQEIFFQNHPPPPSRVKWSAPKTSLYSVPDLSTKGKMYHVDRKNNGLFRAKMSLPMDESAYNFPQLQAELPGGTPL